MPRLSVSQNERILIHLAEFDRYRDEPDVPMAVSQEGIAQRLGTQVFNASRALSALEAEGLVFDRLAHVRGAPKRRRAYFLTEKGRAAASSIRADIGTRKVVLEHAGKIQELTVDAAVRKLTTILGRTVDLSEVVEAGREFDVILSSALAQAEPAAQVAKERVLRSFGKPKVDRFFGRDSELRTIMTAVESDATSIVLIWGMPGIGKSTLASKVADLLVGKRSLLWYTMHDWDTEHSFLGVVSDFLAATGRGALQEAVRRDAGRAELMAALGADLQGNEVIMFLDDVQKPGPEPAAAMSMLVEAVKGSASAKLVMMSRTVPSYFSPTSAGCMSIELTGLDRDSSWKLAHSLNADEAARIVQESHGHPLLLNLMARGTAAQARGDLTSFIEREIFSTAAPEDRRALSMLSVFRHPVQFDALEGVDYKVVSSLRQRALVLEQEDGLTTHDMIREFVLTHLSAAELRDLHTQAARYCARKEGVEWVLERAYHLAEAGDWRGVLDVMLSNAPELAKEFPRECVAMLSKADLSVVSGRKKAEVLFLRGQLANDLGMHDRALSDLEESLSLLSSEADSDRRALVLETVARLQASLQRLSEAMAAHERALRLYEESGDIDGRVRELLNIGGVHRQRGDLAAALAVYAKALEEATRSERRSLQAACLNNIAIIDWDSGRLFEAERKLRESVRLAHAVKDHGGEARALENLAQLCKSLGRTSEAAALQSESSEAFRRAGEDAEAKRMLAESAKTLSTTGRYAEAMDICERALAKPEFRRRKGLFQKGAPYDSGDVELSSALVTIARSSGDLKRARKELARYSSIADAIGDPMLMADARMMQSLVEEDSGQLDEAAKLLTEASLMLSDAGSTEGAIAASMRLGIVMEKKGDYAEAARYYEQAAIKAERAGNKYALSLAQDSLRSVRSNG